MTLWQALLVAFGGNAALLLVLGFLGRSLVQTWLTKDIKKFEAQLKANTDMEIERLKASFLRASRVHERELDILSKLYSHLDTAALFQNMTRGGRMAGEASPEEYAPKLTEAMKAAYQEFSNGRLFIPLALVQLCEGFFKAASQGQSDFAWSLHPSFNPVTQTEFWKGAAAVAYEKLPKILQQINDAARAEIGEANISPT